MNVFHDLRKVALPLVAMALLAVSTTARAELLFHADFDGKVAPVQAKGSAQPLQAPKAAQYVSGVVGQALLMEKDKVYYAREGNVDTKKGTMLLWMKPIGWDPSVEQNQYEWIISMGRDGNKGDQLFFYKLPKTNMGFYYGKKGSAAYCFATTSDWKADEWMLVAMTWNGNVISVYKNGKIVCQKSCRNAGEPTDMDEKIRLQATNPLAYDEFRIYDEALTKEAIKAIYEKEKTGMGGAASAASPVKKEMAAAPAKKAPAAAPPPMAASPDGLLLYAGFEGTVQPNKAMGKSEPEQTPKNAQYVSGVRGSALKLERDRVYWDLANNFNLKTGTVTLWAKPLDWDPSENTNEFDWMFIVGGDGAAADRLMLFKRPNNMICYSMGKANNEKYLYQRIKDWSPNEWRFFALTWDSGVMKFIINGEEKSKSLIDEDNIVADVREVIRLQCAHPFAYDELRIYDRMLTNETIQSLYLQDRSGAASAGESAAATGSKKNDSSLSPRLVAPKIERAPRIDGKIGADEWAEASRFTGFLRLPRLTLVDRQTHVRFCYDNEALYLAIESPVGPAPKADALKRDDKVYSDSSFEILFHPVGEEIVRQLILNTRDVKFDNFGGKNEWDPNWECRSTVTDGLWRAEIRLPFSEMKTPPPKAGDAWRLNFGRNLQGPQQWSSIIYGLAYAATGDFATLEFADEGDFADVDIERPDFGRPARVDARIAVDKLDQSRAVIEVKRAPFTLINPKKIGSFENIAGEFAFRKEYTGQGAGRGVLSAAADIELPTEGLYFMRVSAFEGARPLYSQVASFNIKKPFTVEVIPLSLDDVLKVRWEVARDIGKNLEVTTRMKDKSGRTVQERSQRVTGEIAGELVFDMKPLTEYDYELATTIEGERETVELTSPFKCYKNAEWIGFSKKIGDLRMVPEPWKPVEREGEVVRTLTQEQRFGAGALPEQILIEGRPLLAEPARLILEVDGKPVEKTRRRDWGKAYPDVVSFEQALEGGAARLTGSCEFDGMTRFDLTLDPKGKALSLDRLVLEIPVRSDVAMFKRLYRTKNQAWHVLDLDPSIPDHYEDRFSPHVWIGDDDRGLAWYTESDEHYSLEDTESVIEVERRGDDQVVLRVNMVDTPKRLTEPVTYTFGLMATPSRPLPDDWQKLWFASPISQPNKNLTRYSMIYSAGREYSVHRGVAWPALDPERAINSIKSAHKRDTKVVIYTTSNAMIGNDPQFIFFEQEWKNTHARDPMTVVSYGAPYWGVNPNVESWQDFFLWSTDKAIEEYDIDGLYYDFGTVTATFNPLVGNGYVRDGKEHSTYPMFADRELRKRVYMLFVKRKGEAHFIFHTMLEMVAPLSSFMTLYLDAEPYQQRTGVWGPVVSKDYSKLITLPRLRATMGLQFAAVPYFLPKLTGSLEDYKSDWVKPATRTMVALLLPHGIPIWGFYCDAPELNKYIKAQADFGYETSEFVPYYHLVGEATLAPMVEDKTLVSCWKKPNDWLICVSNLTDEPYRGTLTIDRSRLFGAGGAGAAMRAYDGYTGQDLPVEGDRVSLEIGPKDYVYFRVVKK